MFATFDYAFKLFDEARESLRNFEKVMGSRERYDKYLKGYEKGWNNVGKCRKR